MTIFFCRRRDMWHDNWTYGDWRQYVCNRPGGRTQCAKVFGAPFVAAMVGACLIGSIILAVLTFPPELLAWRNIWIAGSVSAVLVVSPLTWTLLGWRLMRAVGPMNNGSRRSLPWEQST